MLLLVLVWEGGLQAASCLCLLLAVGCVWWWSSFVVVVVGLWCMLSADAKVNIASLVTKLSTSASFYI